MNNDTNKCIINIEEIRKQARDSITTGPITNNYYLNIETACKFLNDALATEIMCVLRYRHCQIIAKGIDSFQVSQEFE